tara:strand:- start:28021 stop:28803 length:783 start_codon:yes stop_codon:yes gene_type:complete
MPGRAENKVCVVTGASQGIGLADAKVLIAEGAKVILTDVDTERGELAAKTLGSNALFVQHDVTNEQGWIRVFEQAVNEYGKVDVLVNNAGILKPGSIVDNTIKDFRLVNAVNCEGVFLGCKHAIPVMEKSGNGGSIINMSSVAALMGISSCVAYCASKGAVRSMTKAIAAYCREQKNGIRCNSVHPGGVRTEMVTKVALGREDVSEQDVEQLPSRESDPLMEPEDIASMVLYLASDESKFVTAAEMVVDNGYTNATMEVI